MAQLNCIDMKIVPDPISKRDYFAAMAMQGILSARLTMNLKEIVEDSLLMADALIGELDKTEREKREGIKQEN